MPGRDILLNVVITMMAGVGLSVLPRVWRGTGLNDVQAATVGWLRHESSRRAFARGGVAAILSFPWLALALWALDAHRYSHGAASSIGLFVGIFSIITFAVIGVALNAMVALFNWPKLLVPPSLRAEPGILETWFNRSRLG